MTSEVEVESVPDPGRTMEGLRDTGYDFETAIADLVDNSIAANASVVDILIVQDFRGAIRVSIADNGEGMDSKELVDAMRYGSPKRPDPASLGKYGLGLKTASTAYCRRLSVISRKSSDPKCQMATWDLDHVMSAQKWILLLSEIADAEAMEQLNRVSPNGSGTVVVWTKVDRLLGNYQEPGGKHAQKALAKKVAELQQHLSETYQRFLDKNDRRAQNVVIRVNEQKVRPWDPFQAGLSELVAAETILTKTGSGGDAEFDVKAFILPRREEFESDQQAKAAKLSSDRQGIYIYRQNRLIHKADWLGMFQKEPHGTLLRVEFSFDHRLDEAFHLDIKKSKIILNDDLWVWLKDQFLPAPRREANRRYREGQKKDITRKSKNAHSASNRNIQNKEAEVGGAKVDTADPETGAVTISNTRGQFKIKLPVGPATTPGEVFVQSVNEVADGLLFEPAIIDRHKAVRINVDHPYYRKVYVPNMKSSVTIQGMDSLLWALSVAELSATTDQTAENFSDMRFEMSRILRKLVESLPEPVLDLD